MGGEAAKKPTPPTRDEGKGSAAALCICCFALGGGGGGGFLSSAHMTLHALEKPLLLLQLPMCAD